MVVGAACSLPAQDIHFSQFQHSGQYLNPGAAGAFDGDQRLVGLYRNQWSAVPVPFFTVSFAYDQKVDLPFLTDGYLGGGLIFFYDRAGDAELSWSQLGLNLAYHHRLDEQHTLGGGFQLQTGRRAFRPGALRFDDQFNGDIFDENLVTSDVFDRDGVGFFDLGAGITWTYTADEKRTRLEAGIAGQHLNHPAVGFLSGSDVQLQPLARFYALGLIELQEQLDLTVNVMTQWQEPYREVMTSAGLRYHLAKGPAKQIALELGAGYRLGDALVALAGLHYNDWFAGFSYDINVSDFNQATNGRGGPEVAVRYIIRQVKPPDTFKACPIY